MSKSDVDHRSRIEITDDADLVMEKCKKALTDFTSAVTFEPETRPAVANLITLHSLCSQLDPATICEQNSHIETAAYKKVVGESVNHFLQPIRQRYCQLMQNPDYLAKILDLGADKAAHIAHDTWQQVKQVVGFRLS